MHPVGRVGCQVLLRPQGCFRCAGGFRVEDFRFAKLPVGRVQLLVSLEGNESPTGAYCFASAIGEFIFPFRAVGVED